MEDSSFNYEEELRHPPSIHNEEVESQLGGEEANKRKTISSVWTHFARKKIDGKEKAICNYCKKELVAERTDGTSHLRAHVKRCKVKNADTMTRQLGLNPPSGSPAIGGYNFDPDLIRQKIAHMIILHEYPLSMVEHVGFIEAFHTACPMFKMMTRNTIRSDILKIYELEKANMVKILEKNIGKIAVTTDMWTSNNQKRGYMTVTGHFIDDSWVLRSQILSFRYLPSPHDALSLSNALVDCLMDWNVDQKLSTLTVDNCTANDAMIPHIKEKLSASSMFLSGKLFHMRCCAHILNLIVKDGLSVVFEDGIERIRDSVSYWTATPKRMEKFEEIARQLKIQSTKKIALDCPTRWNSTYKMLDVAMIYKDCFFRLKQRDSRYKCVPSEDDWILATKLCDKLRLFSHVTELFSGTKYPTTNLFFPKICEIKIAIERWMSSDDPYVKDMAIAMMEKFDKYWKDIHGVMAIATILDPRYKFRLIEYFFPRLYGNESSRKIHEIRQLCYDLVKEYQANHVHMSRSDQPNTMVSSSSDVLSFDDYVDPMADYDMYVSTTSRSQRNLSDLDMYLDETVLPREPNFDILNFWKATGLKYPILSRIARDILAIPITTVASESAFSTSGRYLGPYRAKLHPKTLEALMCTQDWLWSEREASTKITLTDDDLDVANLMEPYSVELVD